MTNREFKFISALQRADSHRNAFDIGRIMSDGRELRAIFDALIAIAHGVDAVNEKLDTLLTTQNGERDAIVTIHHTRKTPVRMSSDGNTPIYEEIQETEDVQARILPVNMGENKMLVEYDDGRLGTAKLCDIKTL